MCCYAFISNESLFMWLNCDIIGSLTYRYMVLDSELSTYCEHVKSMVTFLHVSQEQSLGTIGISSCKSNTV